jgi:hypothetical protein
MTQKTEVIITAKDETRAAIASAQRGLQSLSAVGSRLGQTFASLGVGGGLLGFVGGAGLTATIKQTIDDLDKLNEAAERIGVTVEDLSALNFAGQLNGLEFEEMTTALTKLSVKMQEAASGSKEASDLFADLGIKVTDSAGKLKSSDAVFAEIAERFASFEDGAAKTALAVDLFGKSGAKLVPVLNGGAAGIKSMRDEAEKLGAVIGSDLTKQADEFNDNLLRLSVVSSAAGRALAENLLPFLIQFSSEALVAIKNSDGLLDAFVRYGVMKSLNFKTPTESLAALNKEAQKLEDTISIGRGKDGDNERLRRVQQEISYYTQLESIKNGTGKPVAATGGTEPIKRTPATTGSPKTGAARSQADDAARLIISLREQVALKEVDLQSTDKMTAAEKEAAKVKYQLEAGILKATGAQREAIFASLDNLATLEKLVSAQEDYRKALESAEGTNTKNRQAMFEQIEAAEKAAELFGLNAAQISVVEQARLADAIAIAKQNGASEDQIAVLEEELDLRRKLSGALIKGEEKSQQQKDAEDAIKAVDEMGEFGKQAARNMQDAFADFLFDPFKDGLEGMAANFAKTVQRMVADALAAKLLGALFGDMGKTGEVGGFAGDAIKLFASAFADGGVMSQYGAVPLRKYAGGGIANSPQMAMFGEGSTPEAYVPLPDGRRIPVAMSGAGGQSAPQNIRIVNAFDNSVISDYLGSAAGEKVIMNAVQRNAGAFRQVMNQ